MMFALAALAAVCSQVQVDPVGAAPPRVIERPMHGRAGLPVGEPVDLAVTFDQNMRAGGYSFMRSKTPFPEVIGGPRFEYRRTAVLAVRLARDTDYVVRINANGAGNFRSAKTGLGATASSVVFSTRPWPIDDRGKREVLASLRETLPRHYSHAPLADIPWGARIDDIQEDILRANSALEVGLLVQGLVAEAGDAHLYVSMGGHGFVPPSPWRRALQAALPGRKLRPNVNVLGLQTEMQRMKIQIPRGRSSGSVGVKLTERTGYILIPSWNAGSAAETFGEMASLGSLDQWILDVRSNGGGDEQEARAVAALFAEDRVVYSKRRSLNSRGHLGPMVDVALEPAEDLRPLNLLAEAKVCVLVGPGTMSSSEAFCLMMRASGAILVGEPTLGSSGNPVPRRLSPSITLMTPSWVAFDTAGQPLERSGVAPDIAVEYPEGQAARDSDPAFVRALEVLEDR